ncbi:MAG: glycosyltransferase family 2 protein, partial [Chitinophagaceae bacterium]
CITEDAEASLRILKRGYEAVYVNQSYGQGLMPLTFEGFKKQRFRWCFGGIQILKKHWESLMPWSGLFDPDNKLTFAQRYYYLVGGLQWYNDLLNLFFAFFLVIGGILSLFPHIQGFRPFTVPLLIIPAVFLITGLWRFLWVLRNTLDLNGKEALEAMFNFFSLGWAVTLGSVQGLIQKQGVFLRTPKVSSKLKLLNAVGATQSELLIGLTCLLAAGEFILLKHSLLIFALAGMLIWECLLFMSAPVFSLISTSEQARTEELFTGKVAVSENYAARWILIIMVGIALAILVLRFLPTKSSAPYNKYQPREVSVPIVLPPTTPSPTATVSPSTTPSVSPSPTVTPSPSMKSSTKTTPSVFPKSSPTGSKPSPSSSVTFSPTKHPKTTPKPTSSFITSTPEATSSAATKSQQ